MMQPEALWTPKELAAFLGLSVKTVLNLRSVNPSQLPPPVYTMLSPRWVPAIAQEWAVKNSGTGARKGGRPRL